MDDLMRRAADRVDPEYVLELFKDLIALPSPFPPGDCRAMADRLGREMLAAGMPDVEYVEPREGHRSVIGRIGEGKGPTLTFVTHMDVATVTDEESPDWETPPWVPTIKDGRLYGRGAADCKCALAALIGGVRAAIAAGVPFRGRVMLVLGGNDEAGGTWGVRYLAQQGYLAGDMAIQADASGFEIIREFKGVAWFIITVNGKAVHAAAPELGINAGDKMRKVLNAIADHQFHFVPHPLLGDFTMVLTSIHGGFQTNALPGHCTATFDARLVPGQTVAGVMEELQALLDGLKSEDEELDVTLTLHSPPREAAETPADSKLVRAISEAWRLVTKREPVYGAGIESAGGLPYFYRLGADGVFFGPGGIRQAHMPNEYVELDRVYQTARIYAATIAKVMAG